MAKSKGKKPAPANPIPVRLPGKHKGKIPAKLIRKMVLTVHEERRKAMAAAATAE